MRVRVGSGMEAAHIGSTAILETAAESTKLHEVSGREDRRTRRHDLHGTGSRPDDRHRRIRLRDADEERGADRPRPGFEMIWLYFQRLWRSSYCESRQQ